MANRGKKGDDDFTHPWEIYERALLSPEARKLEVRIATMTAFDIIMVQHFELIQLRLKIAELRLENDVLKGKKS